jgi:CRP-like cAMP-binding protein
MAPVLRRLNRFAPLSAAEIELVRGLGASRKRWRAGTMLLTEGRTAGPQFVLSGWAGSQRVLRDGRRQIFDFILAGESFGFGARAETHERQAVVSLTAVDTVDASAVLEASGAEPLSGLCRALRAMLAHEEIRRLDHMVRLGRLTAYEKAAHFMLEMQHRSGAAEAARSFPLPLTQETMADALGLSVVHLNRVLRQLRATNLVQVRGGVATVHDAKALAAAAVLSLHGGDVAARA